MEVYNKRKRPGRIILNDFVDFIKEHNDLSIEEFIYVAKRRLSAKSYLKTEILFDSIKKFLLTVPCLLNSNNDKDFERNSSLLLTPYQSREEIYNYILKNHENPITKLALYVYRDMNFIDWEPFIKVALERNHVSLFAHKDV